MFERELTKDLNGVGRIIPTKLGISRPTLTSADRKEYIFIRLNFIGS